jgi:hypothetical protein
MAKLISITSDLFFGMKIEAAAKIVEHNFVWISEPDQIDKQWAEIAAPDLTQLTVMVDLATSLPWRDLFTKKDIHANQLWIAYGAHIDRAALDEARDLGIDQVMPRSKFSKTLHTLLAELNKKEAP